MAPQPKMKNTEGLVELVVVDDGLSYKYPGQADYLEPPKTYHAIPADRGDHIFVEEDEAERFLTLGACAKPGSKEAVLAETVRHRTGAPFGAVAVNPESGNTAAQKIEQQARELGVKMAVDDDDEGAVSAEPPADVDYSNEHAVAALNVQQLKRAAQQRGVEVESGDKKDDLVRKLVFSASSE